MRRVPLVKQRESADCGVAEYFFGVSAIYYRQLRASKCNCVLT